MARIEHSTGQRFIGTTFDHAIAYIEKNGKAHSRKVALAQPKETALPRKRVNQTRIMEVSNEPKLLLPKSGIPGITSVPDNRKGKEGQHRWLARYGQKFVGTFDTTGEAVEARKTYIELLE